MEAALGRVRGDDRYAPRPIDIDLVAVEGFEGEVGGRRVPDPDIPRRAFLALPLAEVAPDWVPFESGPSLREMAASFDPARGAGAPPSGPRRAGPLSRAAPGYSPQPHPPVR